MTEINDLKNILLDFIVEQKQFNEKIEIKIDKVQYFLEETIVKNAEIFFDEHIKIKNDIIKIENDISKIKF